MKKKFITNLALLLVLNLLIKPFWIFGIDRTVQNIVGAGNYGFYISLFNFSLLLNVLLDLGITNYNNRHISQHKQTLSKYLSNIVVLKFILAIVYAVISFSIALLIGYNQHQLYLLIFLVFNQFLISFALYLRSNISGLQLFKTDSLLSVLDKTLMIVLCSALLWGNFTESEFKIEWFVYVQTISYLITTAIIFFIVLKKSEFLRLKLDFTYLRAIIRQSYPFAILVLLMSVYNWSGMVILERIVDNGQEQAGIYAQGNRLLDAVSMFGYLFAALLLPMFSKMIKDKENITQLLQLSTLLLIVPAIIIAVGSLYYRSEIMSLLYHELHSSSAVIFAILMFSFIWIGFTYIFGSLLTANGSLRALNIMAGAGVILNVSLNIILIPRYQALGMAVSTLVTQMFTAIYQIVLASLKFKLKVNITLIVKLVLFSLTVFVIIYFSKLLPMPWAFNLIVAVSASFLLAIALKLISPKTIYNIFKYNE